MTTCAWDGCDRPAIKRGHCNSHYERLRRNGRIAIDGERNAEVRFWRKVIKTDGCWTWTAATVPAGYGRVQWQGRVQQAHRVAYELLVGPIPEGLHLDHLCRVRNCVNPAHLEPVTPGENVLRGTGVSAVHAAAEFCRYGHPLSGENLRTKANGWRACRACELRRSRASAATKVRPVKQSTCVECGAAFEYVGNKRHICSLPCKRKRAVRATMASRHRQPDD